MKLLSEKEIFEVFKRFREQNPKPESELKWTSAYTLLVAVVLSAQATDKSVNKATEVLYQVADTPKKMMKLGEENLISYIRSIGLYKTKAKHVIELSKIILEKFNGEVPKTREELESLPGVGRKTANVVLNVVYGEATMPVDTHLFRICPKIGLAKGATPLEVEKSLLERIPSEFLGKAHHWLLLHGRYTCTARAPKCDDCLIFDICKHNDL